MDNVEYANAYSEVLEILKHISLRDFNKIPAEKILLFNEMSNKAHQFKYNPQKTLKEQNVSKRAQAIIAILYRDYWSTDDQRIKILKKQEIDRKNLEIAKKEKYNTDLFENNNKISTEKAVYMVELKDSIFNKIKNWIKRTF